MAIKKSIFISVGFFIVGLVLCILSVVRGCSNVPSSGNLTKQVVQGLNDSQTSLQQSVDLNKQAEQSVGDAKQTVGHVSDGVTAVENDARTGSAAVDDGIRVLQEIAKQPVSK